MRTHTVKRSNRTCDISTASNLEVRETEIALRKLSAGTAHLRGNAGFEERGTCLDLLFGDSNYNQARNQGGRSLP